jgi:hypothetical protein
LKQELFYILLFFTPNLAKSFMYISFNNTPNNAKIKLHITYKFKFCKHTHQ